MRLAAVLLSLAAVLPACAEGDPALTPGHTIVQAVEFPYYLYPASLWERELVWLKSMGIRTVAFSIPWNWHQLDPQTFDFDGRTSPRRNLSALIRLLRRLQMEAWIRPLPPVKGWRKNGYPAWAAPDRRSWLERLGQVLGAQTEKHGGPIAFVEPATSGFDAPPPPQPITIVSATDAGAMLRSRRAITGIQGTLLWEDVEWALYPVGWEAPGAPILRAGAVSLNGDEQSTVAALRRNAALLRSWIGLLPEMRPLSGKRVRLVEGKLPSGVTGVQLAGRGSRAGSAVIILNQNTSAFQGNLRVYYPPAERAIEVPKVQVPPGDALWLPIGLPISGELCRECSVFSNDEKIVYATAELQALEFENGILAMEFSAPVAGEVVLELSREPSGPFLAAGHPTAFDWDPKTQRARLPVPKGAGAGSRVRIGLAIQPPDASAFFVEAKRLIIGRTNLLSTSYSSPELASRSRLRLPEGYTARAVPKSPNEIDYQIDVPSDALHGAWADLAIEADGVAFGRAHLQLFRPASVRLPDALARHFGNAGELRVEPPVIPIDAKSGRNIDVTIRNNYPAIETYQIELSQGPFEFLPKRAELSLGAVMERGTQIRVFPTDTASGLCEAKLTVGGAAQVDQVLRFLLLPRGATVGYSVDVDGDGAPEWILESQRVRAVFSGEDGGRWLEFVWKDSGLNVLPENGLLAGSGPVEVRLADGALEFIGPDWKRIVKLAEATLTIEQNKALPAEVLETGRRNEVSLHVERPGAGRAIYKLSAQTGN